MVDEKHINNSINKAIFRREVKDLVEKRLLEVIKCGVGPSTGYVDGVKYSKDNKQRFHKDGIFISQRPIMGSTLTDSVTFDSYNADNGDIENKQVKAQDKVNWTEDEKRAFASLEGDISNTIGYQLHGEDWQRRDYFADEDEDGLSPYSVYMDDDGMYANDYHEDWFYEGGREEYVQQRVDDVAIIERMFDKSPGLQGDQQLFALDIPNPNLQEGDVFELDTFFPASYKEADQSNKYNKSTDTAIDVNIDDIRKGNGRQQGYTSRNAYGLKPTDYREHYIDTPWAKDRTGKKTSEDLPFNDAYKVTIMGSDGTPAIISQGKINNNSNSSDDYVRYPVGPDPDIDGWETWGGTNVNAHNVFFNKGQKMRVVRIDHEKKTAIYQTVDG